MEKGTAGDEGETLGVKDTSTKSIMKRIRSPYVGGERRSDETNI